MKNKKLFICSLVILIVSAITLLIVCVYKKMNIVPSIKEANKENVIYEESEDKRIEKLSSINIQPMKVNTSETVSIQQGNMYAYVDTLIDSTPENGGQFRSTYGVGETINIVVQFDKIVKSMSDVKMTIQFGDGQFIEPSATISGSKIIFSRILRDDTENGILKVIGLSGSVTDTDDNTVQIGLPSNGIDYIQSNSIIADTNKPELQNDPSMVFNSENNEIEATFIIKEKVYIKNNRELLAITGITQAEGEKLTKVIGHIIFKDGDSEYRGKGTIQITNAYYDSENDRTIVKYKYKICKGDYGTPIAWINQVSDIAGNSDSWAVDGDQYISSDYYTPNITNIVFTDNGKTYNDKDKKYLNAGKEIHIQIYTYDEVYADDQKTELTADNATPIQIKIGEENRDVICSKINDNKKILYYNYTIQPGDNGNGLEVIIPPNFVYDNVGHPLVTPVDLNLLKEDIIIDTTPPEVEISSTATGIYKAGHEIEYTITSTEETLRGEISIGFSEKTETEKDDDCFTKWGTIKKKIYKFKENDNGYMKIKALANSFEDRAGNKAQEYDKNSEGYLYADNIAPTISIIKSGGVDDATGTVKYEFSLKDNSDGWSVYPDGFSKSGVSKNTFTADDIVITNGKIKDIELDEKENIKVLYILAENNGKQKIYIGKNKFSDVAGNQNNTDYYEEFYVDTTPPQIYNIEKSPSEWTNQNVIVKVFAYDESGIEAYSFDGGNTWQTKDNFEVEGNKKLNVQVKDGVGHISTKEIDITNIDKVDPELSIEIIEKDKEDAIIKITATDEESGIQNCEINGTKVSLTDDTYEYIAKLNGIYRITIKDNAGNIVQQDVEITKIEKNPDDIEEKELIILDESLETEKIENTSYIIITKPTTKEEILKQMEAVDENYSIQIKDKDLAESTGDKLKNGDIVTVQGEGIDETIQYKICIKGDINADGEIDMKDIFKLNKYRLGKIQLDTDDLLAGDVNNDKTINMIDIFNINKYRLGKIENL